MNRHDENDDGIDPRKRLRANAGDKLHDLQLRRDLDIINGRTTSELGPLPPGGLPVAPRRKPNLPASASTMPLPMKAGHQENETMDFRSMAVAASMVLTACAPVQEEKPSRKLNPDPKRAYTITMTIAGASGPYEISKGSLQYNIADQQCLPPVRNFAGVQTEPTHTSISFPLTKVADGSYVGTIYLDAMAEENFYGRGICRWELAGIFVTADMQFNSKHFYPSLALWYTPEMLLSEQAKTFYFWKDGLGRPDPSDPAILEAQGPKAFRAEIEAEVFSVTFSSRAVVQ
ncbi:hypothetical protein [Pseudoxanthomonas wuyuanensis]